MGYAFQFVTLAGFHALNFSMFELASGYAKRGMTSYAELQQVAICYSPSLCMHWDPYAPHAPGLPLAACVLFLHGHCATFLTVACEAVWRGA